MNAKLKGFLNGLKKVAPVLVALMVPGGDKIALELQKGIAAAEKMPGATGAEKKAHVIALVGAAVDAENLRLRKKLDKAAVLETADAAIDTVVGVLKVAEKAKAAQ